MGGGGGGGVRSAAPWGEEPNTQPTSRDGAQTERTHTEAEVTSA